MNLRLSVLVFLVLGASSTVASASWFSGYQTNEISKETKATSEDKSNVALSYPATDHLAMGQYYKNSQNTVSVYFLPQVEGPKATLAPSFDVVAREMEQIKQEQIVHEHALITYLQEDSAINVE